MSLALKENTIIPSQWEDTEEDIKNYRERMEKEQRALKERRESIE